MNRKAIFLDRDGTLVHARSYPSRPAELVLFTGVGAALYRLQRAGFALVLITNQSGLARGLFTPAELQRMHDHLRIELAASNVHLDGIYYCPHHVEGVVPELSRACDCRKPAPGMLLQAARDLDLDLPASWMVGDTPADVEAGRRAGCRTLLVRDDRVPPDADPPHDSVLMAGDTVHGLHRIMTVEGIE